MKTRLICLSSERYKTVSVVGTSRCDVRAACSGATLSNCRCHSVIRSARYYAGGDGAARRPYHRARHIREPQPRLNVRDAPVQSERLPGRSRFGSQTSQTRGPIIELTRLGNVPVRSGLSGVKTLEFSGPPRSSDVLRAGTARSPVVVSRCALPPLGVLNSLVSRRQSCFALTELRT